MIKKFWIAVFFLFGFSGSAMQSPAEKEKTLNDKNSLGDTLLHMVVISPAEMKKRYPALWARKSAESCVPENHDMENARLTAKLVLLGAQIDIKNNDNLTPIDIAQKNKD